MGPILAVEMWAGSSEKNWGKKNKSSVKKKIEMVKPTNVVSLNKVGTHLDQRFPTRVSRTPRGTWEISRGTPVWGFHWKCPKNAFSQLTRGYASFSFLCLGVREQKKVGNRCSMQYAKKQTTGSRQPLLLVDFLSANLLTVFTSAILVKNEPFSGQKWTLYCEFIIWGPKWQNEFIANNEGNLYNKSTGAKLHIKCWLNRPLV